MVRCYSSLRALLVVLRLRSCCTNTSMVAVSSRPTGSQQAAGAGALYLCATLCRHHDPEFIRRCDGARAVHADLGPVRLCVVISLIALMIWY
ncbi:universal stress protein UspB [Serratia ureilytica]